MPTPPMKSTFTKPGFSRSRAGRDIDLNSNDRRKYNPAEDTDDDLRQALSDLLQTVGHDLGVDDETDDAFQDFAGDRLSDFGVPSQKIDQILSSPRLKRGR